MNRGKAVIDAIHHIQPTRVPRDFGGTSVSGIHSSLVAELRDHFGLEKQLIRVPEPSSFLGWIDEDLAQVLGVDTALSMPIASVYGPSTASWREWKTPWGQEVLIPANFGLRTEENGDVLAYPQGDLLAPASGKMPSTSFFFDAIIRQSDFDEDDPLPKDNLEEYQPLAEQALKSFVANAKAARATGRAVIMSAPGSSLGDIARIPGVGLRHPLGVRDIEEWYMSISLRPDFVRRVMEIQTEIALENIKLLHQEGGDDLCDVLHLCGTDFGTQSATFCSLDSFNDIWAPSYRVLCNWVHANTPWKIFKHSCGAVESFISSFIEVGFDILNPVQCSASGMDPQELKQKYGRQITFWGGGIDTQQVLPFGSPEQVKKQVVERLRIFAPDGGFVFTPIHNVQAKTPLANILAMIEGLDEFEQAGAN